MLTLLSRRRRPPARPSYARRPALEHLEARNAPSALDPTSLGSFDPSTLTGPAVAATSTDTPSAGGTTSPGGLQPAPALGTFMAALMVPAVPPSAPGGSGSATGGGTALGSAGLAPGSGSPVIDSCAGAENPDLTETLSGHVTDPNPASLTVTFSGWVIDGMHTSVDGGGNFTITFNVPRCTSGSTSSHTCTAVAAGAGRASAPFTFIIEQTPS